MDDRLEWSRKETLFLALCRPALFWGVPLEGMIINVVAWLVIGVLFQSPAHWYRAPFVLWAMVVPCHYAMSMLIAFDYYFFRVARLWLSRVAKGARLANFPEDPPSSPDEIGVL